MLASSRGENTRDDRGVSYLALIARLSAYDLRLHYVAYAALHGHIAGSVLDVGAGPELDSYARVFIPEEALCRAMDYSAEEDGRALTDHSAVILNSEGLFGEYASGKFEYTVVLGGDGPGLAFHPTFLGIQLFMWAHGMTDLEGFMEPKLFEDFVVTPPPEARLLIPKPQPS